MVFCIPVRFKRLLSTRLWAVVFAFLGTGAVARADVSVLSEAEFRAYATEIAKKVNLFAEIWKHDPMAEIYGGTARDYLFWIRGQFKAAATAQDAQLIMQSYRNRRFIDVREFLFVDSDVDVLSEPGIAIDPGAFGVAKIDSRNKEVTDPTTPVGQNEILQGYIPIEKIRLSQGGILETPGLGFGSQEIYSGHMSVHFATPEEFGSSKYAKENLNHPILLALRFLRLQALAYYRQYGSGYPDVEVLFQNIDVETDRKFRELAQEIKQIKTLKKHMEKPNFVKWMNGTIQKSFRSYTNPTAAMLLMERYGFDQLPNYYPQISPMNTYLFAQKNDEVLRRENLRVYGAGDEVYQSVDREFPDGFLYHGTKNEESFRDILIQGARPSTAGKIGKGLYGVSSANIGVADEYANRNADLLLRFEVEPNARIIDIRTGAGLKLWQKFSLQHPEDYEGFAAAFGADLIHYYFGGPAGAYAVKNSAALGKVRGVNRQVLPLGELLDFVTNISDPIEVFGIIELNGLTDQESAEVWSSSKASPDDLKKSINSVPQLQRLLKLGSSRLVGRLWKLLEPDLTRDFQLAFFDAATATNSSIVLSEVLEKLRSDLDPARLETFGKFLTRPGATDYPSIKTWTPALMQAAFKAALETHDDAHVATMVATITSIDKPLDPAFEKLVLDYLRDPAMSKVGGFHNIPGTIDHLKNYLIKYASPSFKFALVQLIRSQKLVGHIWLRDSARILAVTDTVEANQIAMMAFDDLRQQKELRPDQPTLFSYIWSESDAIQTLMNEKMNSKDPNDQRVLRYLIQRGFLSAALFETYFAREGVAGLANLSLSQMSSDEIAKISLTTRQKIMAIALDDSSANRVVALAAFAKSQLKVPETPNLEERLYEIASKISWVQKAQMFLYRNDPFASDKFLQEQSSAIDILVKLRTEASEKELIRLSLAPHVIAGTRLRYRQPFRWVGSVQVLKKMLTDFPEAADRLHKMVQRDLERRELSPEVRLALENLIGNPCEIALRSSKKATPTRPGPATSPAH